MIYISFLSFRPFVSFISTRPSEYLFILTLRVEITNFVLGSGDKNNSVFTSLKKGFENVYNATQIKKVIRERGRTKIS